MDKLLTEAERDEQRRRAITRWWERKSLDDFIARVRARTIQGSSTDAK